MDNLLVATYFTLSTALLLQHDLGISRNIQASSTIGNSSLEEFATGSIVTDNMQDPVATDPATAICDTLSARLPGRVITPASPKYTANREQPWYVAYLAESRWDLLNAYLLGLQPAGFQRPAMRSLITPQTLP